MLDVKSMDKYIWSWRENAQRIYPEESGLLCVEKILKLSDVHIVKVDIQIFFLISVHHLVGVGCLNMQYWNDHHSAV